MVAMTEQPSYKWVTWARVNDKQYQHYTFYPIYDWGWKDVWKAIHDNGWPYNRVYDSMYRHGVGVPDMRISNLHHETAVQSLLLVQEIEPATWERVAPRITGANTIKHLKRSAFACPKQLPLMFQSWADYANHIVDNLVQDDRHKVELRKRMSRGAQIYVHDEIAAAFYQKVIDTVLKSDWDYTLLHQFTNRPDVFTYDFWRRGIIRRHMKGRTKFIPREARAEVERRAAAIGFGEGE